MDTGGRTITGNVATSPDTALASDLFDQFVSAGTFKSVLSTYRQLCEVLKLKPTNITNFYPRLKAKLHSWRAASLWAKLDKRASHKCYNRGKACPNTRVLLIGAGPCGLRAAIEAQLLGAKVVIVEKRDRFSRNNVLHLWPFVIHDLRNLGAKKFFGKFCAGSIDHISIRQLQIILLKVALLLGVEVHENVGFESLIEPPEDQTHERIGWHSRISPPDHPVSNYEFDILIGADGKRNTLLGFNRKEFRGKLAIAVTANFINRHTIEEARVPEISGVAFIFNQKFFQDMRDETGIDLENIVYYKDDTHYFVMTAKKQSLLDRGVIINDYNDTARLLAADNVNREALMEYARDAADFATNFQLPSLDFAVNHYGQADVAMFDFTSMYAAENACRIVERRGHKLLQGLVGDSLLEPFWPTGSGCARGFLSCFDVAWMIRSWASGKMTTLQVLAEREAIYRLLAQTTPENLSKDLNQYTLNPSSRYPNLNLQAVLPSQVRSLYDTDGKIEENVLDVVVEAPKKKRRRESTIHPDTLLNWCKKQVALSDKIKIEDFSTSWKNGLALCTIIHRYRPDLIDIEELNPENIAKNNQLAFDICERELGIPPIMTGQEMADCDIPDKLMMVSYISQVYESFRGEIPVVRISKPIIGEERAISPNKQSYTPLALFNKISNKIQGKRKYSFEKELGREKGENVKRKSSLLTHKRRSKEKDKGIALDFLNNDITLTNYTTNPLNKPRVSINTRVKNLEEQMKRDAGLRCHLTQERENNKSFRIRSEQTELNIKMLQEQLQKNGTENNIKKTRPPKVGKLRKDEWNVKIIEEKSKQHNSVQKSPHKEKPKIFKEIFENKIQQIGEKLKEGDALSAEQQSKYKKFDTSLNKLNDRLTKGNLDVGDRGHNQTALMTEHMTTIWDKKIGKKKDPLPPPPVINMKIQKETSTNLSGSEICYFCKDKIYLLQRSSAEGLFFHRSCFKCEYCNASLHLGNYSFDRDAVCGGKFYCISHFRMKKPDPRSQEIMKRKQAFLSCAFEEEEKERLYKTLLDNTEKALSPGRQSIENLQENIVDSSSISSLKNDQKEMPKLSYLKEPLNTIGRDQTPERVEYENSIIELSEDELLTSELEEEELTQKNFGVAQDLAASEDEYSDLSTDTETDEEAFAEELERSLTADETRKLAETWRRKYSTEHSLIESSSSSTYDKSSDTEIGSDDTSHDIDSDAEYSIQNSEEDGVHTNVGVDESISKVPESKEDFIMEVPVIDLKNMNRISEDETSSESDISEAMSDEDNSEETEIDSESESNASLPPPQIPTIIIDESPPQDVDQDQKWDVDEMPSQENSDAKDSYLETASLSNETTPDKNELTSLINADEEKYEAIVSSSLVQDKQLDGKFIELGGGGGMKLDSSYSRPSNKILIEQEHFSGKNNIPSEHIEDEVESSNTDMTSGVGSLAKEIVTAVLDATKRSFMSEHNFDISGGLTLENNNLSESFQSSINESIINPQLIDEEIPVIDLCSPDNVSKEIFKEPDSSIHQEIPVIDLCSILPLKSNKDDAKENNVFSCITNSENDDIAEMSLNDSRRDEKTENINKSLFELEHKINAKNNILVDSLDESLENIQSYDMSFVTARPKRGAKVKSNDIFDWDSDKSISLPICYKEDSISVDEHCISPTNLTDGIYHASVAHAISTELIEKDEQEDFVKNAIEDRNIELQALENVENLNNISNKDMLKSILDESEMPLSQIKSHEELSFQKFSLSPIKDAKTSHIVPNDTVLPKENYEIKNIAQEPNIKENKTPLQLLNLENKALPIDQEQIIPEVKKDSADISPKSDSKYKGYSGSFAEKIRPKSLFCDTIYLRSLDINLQKEPFSSLNKSSDKLLDSCKESDEKNQNFLTQKDSLKQKEFTNFHKISGHSAPPSANIQNTPITFKEFSDNIDDNVNKLTHIGPSKPKSSHHKHPSVSFSAPESYNDLISPYTYAQIRPSGENNFPTKVVPKCEMDVDKLRQKREKRKSVHEDIQGLPFADELMSPGDPPKSSEVFINSNDSNAENNKTPMYSDQKIVSNITPNLVDEDRYLRLQTSTDQEKARQEARARARLKSDEELGLSPNNYRKKYHRQLSFNSINYDELCSDEFYDQEEDLDDDTISNFCQSENSGILETFNMFKTNKFYTKEGTSESSSQQHSISKPIDIMPSMHHKEMHSFFTSTPKPIAPMSISTGALELSSDIKDDSITNIKHSNKNSSPETSPDIIGSKTPPFDSKFKIKTKSKASHRAESSGEESKSNGKKSLFSLLNFGKSNHTKEKHKTKEPGKDLSSSLPSDLGSRSISKSKPFAHIKLSKSKEKPVKAKAKSVPPENLTISPPPESIPSEEDVHNVSFTTHQAKIIPKYTVYRNLESMLSTFPVHLPVPKVENGLAPKASEDSFSDEDEAQGNKTLGSVTNTEKCKNANEKEKKTQRIVMKVQRQQVLKRLRNAQEIQRRLEELEIQQKELEQQGVELEKMFRGESNEVSRNKRETELMQEWCSLVHSKNKLVREEQELLIRLKDLELEDRQSRLQQELLERMSKTEKDATQIIEERKMLAEMLEIVEKRDELVSMLDQLRLREVEEDKNLNSELFTKGMKSPLSPIDKS